MPKGGRGGQRGGGGSVGPTSLSIGTDTIEMSSPLVYGKKDPALSGAVRAAVETWEAKRSKNKVEYANAWDKNGRALGEVKGSKGSVRIPYSYHNQPGGSYSHIHPREAGILGGTFSQADIQNMVSHTTEMTRAVAKEGTYSISKGQNFDGKGLLKYFAAEDNRITKAYKAEEKQYRNDYHAGKITYAEYDAKASKAANDMLVNLHNALLAGRKQYGYNYTLEKR